MSDILIKGMKMPKNCGECPFIFTSWGIEYYCHLAESSTSAEYVGREKMTNCPLIELPPHGRLIDLDKFKSDYGMNDECAKCDKELRGSVRECETNFSYRKMDFCGWLDDAEVVIEAEGEIK